MPARITDRPEGRQAFRAHLNNAKRRGIPFLFDFETWWAWWQVDDRWAQRGRTAEALVMARVGDLGPYSPENVYVATQARNHADIPVSVRSSASAKGHVTRPHRHLNVRGAGHPKSKAVATPAGVFGSAALAAEHHGIARQTAARWAREQQHGWAPA